MAENKYPPLVIRTIGNTETGWTLEGTEKDPKRMAWAGHYRIVPTSKVREDIPAAEGGGYRYRQIRHILGCDFIDPIRQEKEGFKPNPAQDNIWLINGSGTFLHEGAGIGTYLYLKAYEGNISNPLRPPDAGDEFEEVVAVEIAKVANTSFDKKADAYQILREIRQPGDEGYIYDAEKLGLLTTLFGLNHLDSQEEKFHELYAIADSRPDLIVDSIANGKKKMFATIMKAETLNVISFTDDRVYFTDKKSTIMPFKTKLAKNNQVNRLSDFLVTEEGKPFLLQLEKSVDIAAQKTLAPL